eukprot:CAMPEP_0198531606 /NCGR_PEP_ID=MMETSP1462-20131121/27598_1 /TAXON_ID=1333877 /ORGANISM="Brandtodinium nutriculum, Strain RCC3387" /LENGTH=44 /DNA_ID= /DNA_START= /DNA_END= /DNA_ORIENTATION=
MSLVTPISYGIDEWCRLMRNVPAASSMYPKEYSTFTLVPARLVK